MSKPKFVIQRPDDENVIVFLNGHEIGAANHDSDGWSGMESLTILVKNVAAVLKIPVVGE